MIKKMHVISVTGIVVKDGKYLITKRSLNRKSFPGKWTVPGGNLELSDYKDLPKDTKDHWYSILEKALKREIKEEVNLEVKNLGYVTSLSFIRGDGIPILVISLYGDYAGGEIKLEDESTGDYKWVSLEEAREYDFIEGIYEELVMLDRKLNGEGIGEWENNLNRVSEKITLSDGGINEGQEKQKIKLGIDIDEVLVEFLEGFLEFYNETYNKDFKKEDFKSYIFEEILGGTHEDAVKLIKEFKYGGDARIVDGSIESLNNLVRDFELFAITARHPMFKVQTDSFLEKNFKDIFLETLYTGEAFVKGGITKADLCVQKGIKIMIEDNSVFASELAEKGIKVFLLDKPWNQDFQEHENIVKVNSWNEILEKIGVENE